MYLFKKGMVLLQRLPRIGSGGIDFGEEKIVVHKGEVSFFWWTDNGPAVQNGTDCFLADTA
jgi:hypothetical protein